MKRYIAIDSGKSSTKIALYDPSTKTITKRSFRTRIGEGTFEDDDPGTATYLVQYEGKTYKIGANADTDASLDTSKKSFTHKLCTLYAIASFCSENEVDEVNAAIGIPVKDYEVVKNRNEYREYILPDGEITLSYKLTGTSPIVTKTFRIVTKQVYPESLGAIFADGVNPNDTVAVIDIGHLNINQTIYNAATPDKEYSITSTLGGNALVNGLSQKLSSTFSFVDNKKTAEILTRPHEKRCLTPKRVTADSAMIENESREVIDKYLLDHVKNILEACRGAQWSVDYLDMVFIGGTTNLLRNEIYEIFGEQVIIPQDPVFANVCGFLKILCGKTLGIEINLREAA